MSERPQYYTNDLDLPQINEASLRQTLEDLRHAVLNGVKVIESNAPASGQYDGRGMFTGELGIPAAYLRLGHQVKSLGATADFYTLAGSRIPVQGPDVPLRIGGLSPLASKSPIATVTLRILHKCLTDQADGISHSDLECLTEAVQLALSHGSTAFYHGHNLGADEVLFGRAGLLWALLNIRTTTAESPPSQKERLQPILDEIPELIRFIIDAGREGAADYAKKHGRKAALPLMWPWKPGDYGVGWAHGLCGIIPVLLACPLDELANDADNYLPEIGGTISALCEVCIARNGHLPTKIPPRSSSRESPLVQMCHGAPAILGLLGCALKHRELLLNHWEPSWNRAARLATDRVWEEGLLSKGGGLCHGIAGNAWPFLLLHDAHEYNGDVLDKARQNYAERSTDPNTIEDNLTGDEFLSRALAMLLHARETQPYNASPETASNDYRIPDHPYSLFEGLAGIVCAWAEACVLISARLRKAEVGPENIGHDHVFRECMQQQLGFPFLGGNGATGVP
ncbi:lanthionine synthetase C family protein [Aspergillus mulundensis]|uniref:Lanthionine synthetase C family protein n=1 Tax=Aspergillus mulundensis TaxID=1810919 RepID=A0A3D8R026_9EURO|nr:hypothetical protein DSM5745_09278 [Aspergillus mulundensis]RDW67412.1 hypothetical protein DSM5745_09278 [Aspergillus mulundensis]